MEKLYGFTEKDIAILRDIIQKVKSNPSIARRAFYPDDAVEGFYYESYLARTPEGGIPALSVGDITGTGDDAPYDDIPGEAECDIYRLLKVDGVNELTKTLISVTVYNFSQLRVPGSDWVIVTKDPWGTYYATNAGLSFQECT